MTDSRRPRFGALWIAILVLAAIAPGLVSAAGTDERLADKPYWRTNLFKRFAYDQKFLVTRWFPQEFQRAAFTGPLVGAILIAANSAHGSGGGYDAQIQTDFGIDRSNRDIQFAHGLTTLGNSPVVAAALGITYLASRRAGNDHLAETASLSAEALLDVGLWTIVLKEVSARSRPGPGSQGEFFQYGHPRSGSFPSGHAAVAFSLATVFAEEYGGRHRWVPWFTYGAASLIGIGRVALGQHFPADVLFGATLGHSVGEAVMAQQGEHGGRWYERITPIYDTTHQGWGLSYRKTW